MVAIVGKIIPWFELDKRWSHEGSDGTGEGGNERDVPIDPGSFGQALGVSTVFSCSSLVFFGQMQPC